MILTGGAVFFFLKHEKSLESLKGKIKSRNLNHNNKDIIQMSEGKKIIRNESYNDFGKYGKGLPTKIKLFKCLLYSTRDPSIDEKDIENILRKSGSNIFEKGGFVSRLTKNN